MALKDGARSWLLNLPVGSISSWGEMREHFVANFQGTRDRPPATGDLCRVRQQSGETLHVRRLRSKKGAAKRSHVPWKVLSRSQCRRAEIAPQRLHDGLE